MTQSPHHYEKPCPGAVKAAREAAEMTQVEAAASLGISKTTWASYEQGTRNMPATSFRLFKLITGQERISTHTKRGKDK